MSEPVGEINRNKEEQIALREVRKFTTRLWEHPLLNKETRRHRIKGIHEFNKFIENSGLNSDDYIAIPYGSVIWVVTRESDWDFRVIARTDKAREKLVELNKRLLKEKDKLSINHVYPQSEIMRLDGDAWIRLLLTPDDYIGGSVDYARRLRRFVSQAARIEIFEGSDLDDYFKFRFQENYSRLPFETSFRGQNKRQERARKAMSKRASKSKMGSENYVKEFNKALNKFEPPSLFDYAKALSLSGGKLTLDSRYIATSY